MSFNIINMFCNKVSRKDKINMSLDFRVKIKSLPDFDKIAGNCGFGVYEGDFLDERIPEPNEEFILYDNEHIGRGVSVYFENDTAELHLPMPTCDEDISLFFDIIERICENETDFTILDDNDEEVILSELASLKEKYKGFNTDVIMSMIANADDEKKSKFFHNDNSSLSLFSAKFELNLNKETALEIRNSDDPAKAFGIWLHKCQNTTAKFIPPRLFGEIGDITGAYIIPENTECIVPLKGQIPFGLNDENGNPLKADNWAAAYFSEKENKILHIMDYSEFIERVKDKSRKLDALKIIVNKIDSTEAADIFG